MVPAPVPVPVGPWHSSAATQGWAGLIWGLVLMPPLRAVSQAKICAMAAPMTVNVEIDRSLLERLRKRRPEKSDRELVESVARIQLGREASDRAKERFAGVPSGEIEREAVKAAREVRRERAAARRRRARD